MKMHSEKTFNRLLPGNWEIVALVEKYERATMLSGKDEFDMTDMQTGRENKSLCVVSDFIRKEMKGGFRRMEQLEKYLRIKVEGKEGYLKAFLNSYKETENDQDYKGEGVAIWINDKKPKEEREQPRQEAYKPKVVAARTL